MPGAAAIHRLEQVDAALAADRIGRGLILVDTDASASAATIGTTAKPRIAARILVAWVGPGGRQ